MSLGFIERGFGPGRNEILPGHHLADPAVVIFLKFQIAAGENAHQLGRPTVASSCERRRRCWLPNWLRRNRRSGTPLTLYCRIDLAGLPDRRAGRERDGIDDDAVLAALDLLNFAGLIGDGEILVDEPDAAFLRQRDRERGFGDGIHGGADERDIQIDAAREAGMRVRIAGNEIAASGEEQNVVKGDRVVNDLWVFHVKGLRRGGGSVKR